MVSFFVTAAILLIIVLCIEIILHVPAISDAIGFNNVLSTYRMDPVLYYRHVANSRGLSVDRLGYDGYRAVLGYNSRAIREDKEIELPKPSGCYRVLLLGDSVVEAAHVPLQLTLGKRLENKLSMDCKQFQFEVLNSGVSGWSTSQEYIYYKNEGASLNPDMVIICFCLNDVTEDYRNLKRMKTDENDLPIAVAPDYGFIRRATGLGRQIKLYALFADFLMRPLDRRRALMPGGVWRLNQIAKGDQITRSTYALFNEKYSSSDEMCWDRTKRYILAIKEIADRNAQQTVLVCIPLSHQVSPLQNQLGKQCWGPKWKDYVEESTKPQGILRELAKENNMHFVDLLPAFKDAGRTQKLFYDYDGHFNEQGHELAARTIADYILTNILKQ